MNESDIKLVKDPFKSDLSAMFTDPKTKRIVQKYDSWLRWLSGLQKVEEYNKIGHYNSEPGSPWCKLLKQLNINYNLNYTTNDRIPEHGAVIVIANHPFGMLDGIIIGSMLRKVRADIKMLSNQTLISIKNLAPDLLGVDPYNHAAGIKANLKPLRNAKKWLQQGGLLTLFPSGTVSHVHNYKTNDCPWHATILRFLLKSNAPILPVYFAGKNSKLFYKLRKINERFGSLLLVRELLKKRGQHIEVKIGRIIPAHEYSQCGQNQLEAFLRQQLYQME